MLRGIAGVEAMDLGEFRRRRWRRPTITMGVLFALMAAIAVSFVPLARRTS
jgi:hypothetical protein